MAEHTRRLFFALWPDAAQRAALDAAGQALTGKRVRRVAADNLHLTMAFAGSVSAATQACLERQAAAIRAAPFALTINHAGYFPRPRILWIGPEDVPGGLWALAGALRQALVDCGISPGLHAFQAHVTVARKYSEGAPARSIAPLEWSIRDFRLVESVSTENGVRYRPLRSWPLEGE
ncbi:MAG: RNA 2',3'-cyclic phosphodiesterase [Gammaproteobacteria bacterium]|nr:RNA 2',3'-cyclic phosphodiesterase [Gammaproteobacteria bacterium]